MNANKQNKKDDPKKVPDTFNSILVLRGGPGVEREVSLAGGRCVAAALRKADYKVIEKDIFPEDLSALDEGGFDLVFPVLHGRFGEDGQLQKILEERGIAFIGSGSESSRLAMDKFQAKKAFKRAGLLVPRDFLLKKEQQQPDTKGRMEHHIEESLGETGLPCVVKPNSLGSSVGVVIAREKRLAVEAIQTTLHKYGDCLVEQYIAGRELTVGIVADQLLPVLEVRPAKGFYDYQAKYLADDTQYIFEPDLAAELPGELQRQGQRAFAALGCRDLARMDFIVDDAGKIFVLEVNTIPGFTDHSLVPKAAAKMGWDMKKLCNQIVLNHCVQPI